MRRHLLLSFLFVISSVTFAQTQQGYVKTRGRLGANGQLIPGVRLQDATISVKNGGSHVSGKNGTFSFAVPSQTFYLTKVQKKGYELCDRDVLGKNYKYSANPLVVVMDTPDNTTTDRLAAEKKIRRTLQCQLQDKEDEIETLKEEKKINEEQYRKQLQELYTAQENNEKLISYMAERYSTLDFENMDDFQRQVSFLIQNGELAKADSLLKTKDIEKLGDELDQMDHAIQADAEDIAKRQTAHNQAVEYKSQKLEKFASLCYSNFEICKLQHKNDSAAYWLELRASKDTMNVEWQLEVGNFIADYLANYNKTLQYYQKSLRNAISQNGETGSYVATSYNCIGSVYRYQGDNSKALEYYQKALDINLQVLGENHSYIATSYIGIGNVYSIQGDYARALEYYDKAMEIFLQVLGKNHPNFASLYLNIGSIYCYQGDYARALEYYQKGLDIRLQFLGESHPNVASCYNNIGYIYERQGGYVKALEYHRKALDIRLQFFGENHPNVGESYNNIGYVYDTQGDYSKALEYYRKSLDIRLKFFGEKHSEVGISYRNIGYIYCCQGDYARALEYYDKAMEIFLQVLGKNHPHVGTVYSDIGSVYRYQGNYAGALEYYGKFLGIFLQVFGDNHPCVAAVYSDIGSVYDLQCNFDKAMVYYQKALGIYLQVLGENHPDAKKVKSNIEKLKSKIHEQ